MLICEIGRAAAVASVAIAVVMGVVSLPQLMVVAFIDGTLFVFFDLFEGAALPRIVRKDQLSTAIAQNQARTQGADLVGQPLGGALFSIAHAVPFLADAISYIVSFGAIALIRTPLQEPNRDRSKDNLVKEIREGISTVRAQPFLRAAIATVAGINFSFNALALVMIVKAQSLGADPALIGVMFAFFGAGGIVGSIVAPSVQRRFGSRAVILGITWIWAVQMAVLAFVPNVLLLGIVAGIGATAGPPFNVVIGDLVYRVTPDRLMGRVRSVIKLVAWSTIPLGALAAGLLSASFGPTNAILFLAAVLGIVAVLATVAPGMRHVPAESR
jgi:predicted MFS family arabinose efflux permease